MEKVRKGQAPAPLTESAFRARFDAAFADPSFATETAVLERVATIAWRNYEQARKAPVTRRAGDGYADPEYELSVEWVGTSERLRQAEVTQRREDTPSRVLVIAGAARNDGSCPGEMSKTFRLAQTVAATLQDNRIVPDLLDLSPSLGSIATSGTTRLTLPATARWMQTPR